MRSPRSEVTTPNPAIDRTVICAVWERWDTICISYVRVASNRLIFVSPTRKTIVQDYPGSIGPRSQNASWINPTKVRDTGVCRGLNVEEPQLLRSKRYRVRIFYNGVAPVGRLNMTRNDQEGGEAEGQEEENGSTWVHHHKLGRSSSVTSCGGIRMHISPALDPRQACSYHTG
jgi:hypothetical protein